MENSNLLKEIEAVLKNYQYFDKQSISRLLINAARKIDKLAVTDYPPGNLLNYQRVLEEYWESYNSSENEEEELIKFAFKSGLVKTRIISYSFENLEAIHEFCIFWEDKMQDSKYVKIKDVKDSNPEIIKLIKC